MALGLTVARACLRAALHYTDPRYSTGCRYAG